MIKKILVTGSGTFVGNEIAKKVLSQKFKLIAAYNKNYPKNLNGNIEFLKLNLKKKFDIKKKFDVLIHCAFRVPSYGLNRNNYNLNIKSFQKILEICKKRNCKRIIFLSQDFQRILR